MKEVENIKGYKKIFIVLGIIFLPILLGALSVAQVLYFS